MDGAGAGAGGGDGRDGMLLDCFNPSQMLWKPSYYLVRGSSLDLVLTTLVDLMVGSIRLGLVGTREED